MSGERLRNFIGGEYVDAKDGRTLEVVDPSTGEVYAEAPVSGAAASCPTTTRAMLTSPVDRSTATSTTQAAWPVSASASSTQA